MINNYRVVLGYLSRVSARKITDRKDIDEIKRLYQEERWTTRALGEKYNVDKKTISDLLRREGVQMRTMSEAQQKITDHEAIDEIKRLYNQRWTTRALGEKYNVTADTISDLLEREGVKRRTKSEAQKKITERKDIDEIKRLYDEGWTQDALGEKYNTSRHAIGDLLDREGVKRRTMSEAVRKKHGLEIDDNKVVDLFFNSEWAIIQIARKFKTTSDTIRLILRKYVESQGMEGLSFKRGTRVPAKLIPKIIYDYDVLKDNASIVGQRYGFSIGTINRVLDLYNIPIRSRSEAQKLRHQKKREMPKTGSFYD